MKTVTFAELKTRSSTILKQSKGEPIVVTRSGRPVAVLIGVRDDEEAYRLTLANSPKLRAILDAGQRQIDAGLGIPHEEFWRQVEEENAAKNGAAKVARRKPSTRTSK